MKTNEQVQKLFEQDKYYISQMMKYLGITQFREFSVGYLSDDLRCDVQSMKEQQECYSLKWCPENPDQLDVYTWNESYHNGDSYGERNDTFLLDAESFQAILKQIYKTAEHKAEQQLKKIEKAKQEEELRQKVKWFLAQQLSELK